MKKTLLGCPMHWGVSERGLLDSIDVLVNRYPELAVELVGSMECTEQGLANLKNLNSVVAVCEKLAAKVDAVLTRGEFPVCIGGDHALAMGSVAGSAKHCRRLGLLWIDSHSDINTHLTTATGNIHGMPVSASFGLGHPTLTGIYGYSTKLQPQDIVVFGLRDVDPPERDILNAYGVKAYDYSEICERGLQLCLDEAIEYLAHTDKVHISFDLDSMDPEVIKGVTVPVASGFTIAEADLIWENCFSRLRISAIDLVEYNPRFDSDKRTLEYLYDVLMKIEKCNLRGSI